MAPKNDYAAFLEAKGARAQFHGVPVGDLHPSLFPFQVDIVSRALSAGRYAVFADTGLGKTRMQLEIARRCFEETGRPSLILCPLAVAGQTQAEGRILGLEVSRDASLGDIRVVNYDRLKEVDPSEFGAVLLDESSILKNFSGKTKQELCHAFRETPYRFCFTATPAPNDHAEIGNHSQFLGVMDSSEMLMRFFAVDQSQAGNYRLKGHAKESFWEWVASWAVAIRRPSQLGYSDEGYILPSLHIERHTVEATGGTDSLIPDARLSATTLHKEMRATSPARAAEVARIVALEPDEQWLIWCNTDYEADALKAILPGAVEVRGSMPAKTKEERLLGFASGDFRVLITKPSVAGFGMNWQGCARMAFVGLSYSYEQLYQAIRRCWRYGQSREVYAHVVTAESEWSVLESIERKQEAHERMVDEMVAAVSRASDQVDYALRTGTGGRVEEGTDWRLLLGDCIERTREIESDSVGISVFSPPFSNLYTYSDALADMGNCAHDDEFFEHFGYLAPELLRVTQPGRLCVIHCKDLPKYLGKDGAVGLRDFPGECRALFERHGWTFHPRVTIWKCPVTERERTNNNGLLHKTVCRDRSQLRMGMADFLIIMRKSPVEGNSAAEPIGTPEGFTRYIGDPELDPRETEAHPSPFARKGNAGNPSIDVWRRYAEPVWWDIDQTDVLNVGLAREQKDEKHICPLQLGVIRRAIEIWSNPGDLVFSPFAGIGSEGFVSLQEGRRFVGIELKESYFRQAVKNLTRARSNVQIDLFAEVI